MDSPDFSFYKLVLAFFCGRQPWDDAINQEQWVVPKQIKAEGIYGTYTHGY